jgi:hypothetical protein
VAIYEFVLKFALPDLTADPARYLDALFAAGCDDAIIGIGSRGSIALDFAREAPSAESAVESAIKGVTTAIPGARLVQIDTDIEGLTCESIVLW